MLEKRRLKMLDYIEDDIIICFMCEDRLIFGEQYRNIDEGIVCSIHCNNEYLGIDKSISELIDIHREQAF